MEEIISDALATGKRVTTVYSPELKLALFREYVFDGQEAYDAIISCLGAERKTVFTLQTSGPKSTQSLL